MFLFEKLERGKSLTCSVQKINNLNTYSGHQNAKSLVNAIMCIIHTITYYRGWDEDADHSK